MAEKHKGIRTQHPEYAANVDTWKQCRDASAGERAIHDGGTAYLPMLTKETDADYRARKARTPFFNATWRTIAGLKGMLFRNAPQIEVPAGIAPYMADVDMAGTPVAMFTQELAEEVLEVGRGGLLVDAPPLPETADGQPLTQAQAESLGLRPMLQYYPAESVINWKTARVANVVQLVLVVLKEETPAGDDPYSHKTETRYRELTLTPEGYRQRVFRINDKDEDEQVGPDIFPTARGQRFAYIPFMFVGTDDCKPEVELPPLLDLIDMNVHHYQVSADWEHGCHFQGLPTLFVSGWNGDSDAPIYIGGPTANGLADPNAKAWFAEVQSNFEAIRNNLQDKQSQMAVLGARMLENSKPSVEAADTLRQRSQGEQSALSAFAEVLGMAMTRALSWMAEWAGAAGEVSVKINKEFIPTALDAPTLTAIVAGWQAGVPGMSGQNVYAYMQRTGMADPEVKYEEEQERIASSGPRGDSGLLVS